MRVYYTPRYYADIGDGHVFPIRKFELVRDRLLREGILRPADLVEPEPAPLADVLLVHTEDYVTRLRAGALTPRELRRLGLAWSKALVRRSTLDIDLPDDTRDTEYLATLAAHLPRVFAHRPEVIFYLGGADPYVHDKLGRLALTIGGLRARDEFVLSFCRAERVPVVTVMSGGYAAEISDTVEIHCNTIRAVRQVFAADESVGVKLSH